jgi:hypothetical protein
MSEEVGDFEYNKESITIFLDTYKHRFPDGLTVFPSDYHVTILVKSPKFQNGLNSGHPIRYNMPKEQFKGEFEYCFNYLKAILNAR